MADTQDTENDNVENNLPADAEDNNSQENGKETNEKDILDPTRSEDSKSAGERVQNAKDMAQKASNSTAAKAVIHFLFATPVGWTILGILVIIIVIVGVYYFFTTIPGLMIGNLKDIAQNIGDTIQSWYRTEADAFTNESDVIELANYLEEMEYDLIGYGFVMPSVTATHIPDEEELEKAGFTKYSSSGTAGRYGTKNPTANYPLVDYDETDDEDNEERIYFYDGAYYSGGKLIDNATGQAIVEIENGKECTIDDYGFYRSTDEFNSNGDGVIVYEGNTNTKLLRTYLLSDYRIYSIRNDDEGTLNKIYKSIKSFFGGYDSAWAKGLLKFYSAEDGVAIKKGEYFGDNVTINGTQLSIREGFGNNSINYDIDGWADRYGMSLEFLLSLHLATGAPDLVYAMLQSFDTEVQVYLNDSGKAEVQSAYVDLLNSEATLDNRITYNELTGSENYETDIFGRITNKSAKKLMTEFSIVSPDNCTGVLGSYDYVVEKATYDTNTTWEWSDEENQLINYGITNEVDPEIYELGARYSNEDNYATSFEVDGVKHDFTMPNITISLGNNDSELLDDYYTLDGFEQKAIELGCDESLNISGPISTTFEDVKHVTYSRTDGTRPCYTGNIYNVEKTSISRTWYYNTEDNESVQCEWVTYKYVIYETGSITRYYKNNSINDDNIDYEEIHYYKDDDDKDDEVWVDTILIEYIIRNKTTQELEESGMIDENGNEIAQKCSDDYSRTKACDTCTEYMTSIKEALKSIYDSNYEYYTPYIARVLGSWFRDTYFIIPDTIYNKDIKKYGLDNTSKSKDTDLAIGDYISEASRDSTEISMIANSFGTNGTYVNVDEDYLADSGEYWTEYETKDNGEYQLYYLQPNGITSEYTLEDFLSNPETVLNETGYTNDIPDKYIEDINKATEVEIARAQEAAEADGFAFVKKAETRNFNVDEGASLGQTVWSAYQFDVSGTVTWEKINYKDDDQNQRNNKVDAVYDNYILKGTIANEENGGFYFENPGNTVVQAEDAQRSQTNPTVKWLFKYRKYYLYDGSASTAEKIAEDKEAVTVAVAKFLNENVAESSVDASKVAELLEKYGRSALKQTYANIKLTDGMFYVGIDTLTEDGRDLAEQWLEWQLDMYYSGVINGYYNENGKYIVYDGPFLDDINWDEYGLTGRGNGDPRDPDLIGTVAITKSSLDAFSILENTKTLAAEYAYRDFKELIVELDYFDKEDLSDKIDSVFTWVIPELDPIGWPTRKWDKQDINYGILIESASTYDYLEEINYDPTLLDSSGEEDEEEDNTEEEENSTEINTNDSNSANTTSIAENKIFYIGDSWIERLENYGNAASPSSYFDGVTSTNARDHDSSISVPSDASCIVVAFGLNDTDAAGETQTFIDELVSNNTSLPVYVLRTPHVGSGYTFGTINANTMNSNIDNYNSEMKSYCEGKSYVYYIDPTSNIVEDNGNGYLKDEYKDGEYHLNSEGNKQWYKDIISIITSDSGITTAVKFDGYEGGELVASPVTGKVIEYGTHERINIYTGDTEEVGYITIQAMDSGEWFTEDNVSNNSGDTDDVSNADIAEGLNLFYDEYEDVCAGYTITIDGFNVDLNIQDESENNGSYEQNEVMALYNLGEQRKREDNEEKKDNAPFFVCVDGDDAVGSLPDTYESAKYDKNDKAGYYIKEGKYIGSTYTDDDVTNNITEDVENGSVINIVYKTKTDEEGNEVETSEVDHYEYYDGPANYIRMMVKTTDFSVIDNVEDFFDIPDPEDETTTAGNAELSDLELLFFTAGEGGPWKEYNDIAGSYFKTRTDNPNGLTFVANKKNDDNLEVGIIQWTTNSRGLNNIQAFCKAAYEYNSTVFSALSAYADLSNSTYTSNSSYWSSLAKDMLAIWNSNPNELMNFEISYAKEGYYEPAIQKYPWLAERPSIVQGMVMSIYVYQGTNYSKMTLTESMTDEEIVDACQPHLNGRTWQTGFAKDYLAGNISADQLEEFVYYGTIDGVAGTSKY